MGSIVLIIVIGGGCSCGCHHPAPAVRPDTPPAAPTVPRPGRRAEGFTTRPLIPARDDRVIEWRDSPRAGFRCPACGSTANRHAKLMLDGGGYYQATRCEECRALWEFDDGDHR